MELIMRRQGHALHLPSEVFAEEFERIPAGVDIQVRAWMRRTNTANAIFHSQCASLAGLFRDEAARRAEAILS